jgi:hypothetical protein
LLEKPAYIVPEFRVKHLVLLEKPVSIVPEFRVERFVLSAKLLETGIPHGFL